MDGRFTLIPAVYLLLRRDDEILLLQRANTGYQDGKYSLIAGHLDGNEVATDGIIREAKEEAGISVNTADLKFVHLAHRLSRGTPGQERLDLFFECRQWDGNIINREPQKCADLTWYSLHKLPANIIPFVQQVLQNVEAGVTYSEYMHEPV